MNKNISLLTLFAVTIFTLLTSADVVAGAVIERAAQAETACKELSAESLTEIGLAPHNWRAETSNASDGFSIEGQWQTKAGSYLVECEVGFGKTLDELEINIIKD